MPTHAETKYLPYTVEQMFDLVADVNAYPAFLPWCRQARIWKREDDIIYADLVIGYRLFQERFTSKAVLLRPNEIQVSYIKGPLRYLSNSWRFADDGAGGCRIDFHVDFEFKNPVFRKVMGVFFSEAVRRMVSAFEGRAISLYGAR